MDYLFGEPGFRGEVSENGDSSFTKGVLDIVKSKFLFGKCVRLPNLKLFWEEFADILLLPGETMLLLSYDCMWLLSKTDGRLGCIGMLSAKSTFRSAIVGCWLHIVRKY